MTGRLDESLRQLLVEALPALFGGNAPPVQLSIVNDLFTLDPRSAEAEAGEPRVDNQVDQLPFDPAHPAGPYTLTRPPTPGPRRFRLTNVLGDRVPLLNAEVIPDSIDSAVFRLQPRADRDLTPFNGLQVLYGVTAVFVQVKGTQTFALQLQSADAARLAQAESLALAALELNRARLIARPAETFHEAAYSAHVAIETLKLVKVTAPLAASRELHYVAEVAVKCVRALVADEGRPIVRILSPGQSAAVGHPVRVEIGVDA